MCSLESWRHCQAKFPCLTGRHGHRERHGEGKERERERDRIKTSEKETKRKKEKKQERKSSKSKNAREQRTGREGARDIQRNLEQEPEREGEGGTECADAAFLV